MTYGIDTYGSGDYGGVAPVGPPLTIGYLMDRTFDLLLQSAREERNQLATDLDGVTTKFQVTWPLGSLQRGTYLAIDDEVMYVWDTTPGSGNSSTVTVQRGDKGSAASTHSANAIIAVNPYFTRFDVRKTLQDEIRSWGPQVFQVKTVDLSTVDFNRGYDLGIIGPWFYIINVTESPDLLVGLQDDNDWRQMQFRVDQSANTSIFPSGSSLTVTDPLGVFDSPRTIHVTFAAPLDVDTTFKDTDAVTVLGMDQADIDIAPYGAAWRLATGREVRRLLVEGQGQNSDLQNFPPGYMVKAAADFKQFRDSRLQDAQERLRSMYPIRRTS